MKLLSMDFAVHGIQFYRDGYFPSYLNTHNYFNLNKWHDVQGGFRTFYIRNPKGEQSLPEGVVKKELFVSGINPPKGFEFDPAERDQWVQKLKAIIDGPERKSYRNEFDGEGKSMKPNTRVKNPILMRQNKTPKVRTPVEIGHLVSKIAEQSLANMLDNLGGDGILKTFRDQLLRNFSRAMQRQIDKQIVPAIVACRSRSEEECAFANLNVDEKRKYFTMRFPKYPDGTAILPPVGSDDADFKKHVENRRKLWEEVSAVSPVFFNSSHRKPVRFTIPLRATYGFEVRYPIGEDAGRISLEQLRAMCKDVKTDEIDWLDQDSMPKYPIPHFPNKPWYGNGSATINIHLETTLSEPNQPEVFTAKQAADSVLHEVQHLAEQTREKVIESTIPNLLDWARKNPTVTIGAADLNRMLNTITELPNKEEWATGIRHIGDAFWRTIEDELHSAKYPPSTPDDDFPFVVAKDCSAILKAPLPPDDADWSFTEVESAYDNSHWGHWLHQNELTVNAVKALVQERRDEIDASRNTTEDKDMIEVPNPSSAEYKLRKIGDAADTLVTYAQGVEMFAKLYHVYDEDDKQDTGNLGSQLYNLLSQTSADSSSSLLNELVATVKKISNRIIADKGGEMHPHAIVLTDSRKLPIAVCTVHGELCTIRYVKASAGPVIEIYPVTVENQADAYRGLIEGLAEMMNLWKTLNDEHVKNGERGSYILQAPNGAHSNIQDLRIALQKRIRKVEGYFDQLGSAELMVKLIHAPSAEAVKAYSIASVKARMFDEIIRQWGECEVGLEYAFKAPIISLHETIKNAAQMFKETKSD